MGEAVRLLPRPAYIRHIGLQDGRVPEVVVVLVELEGLDHVEVLLAVGGPVGVHVVGVPLLGGDLEVGGQATVVGSLVDPLEAEE